MTDIVNAPPFMPSKPQWDATVKLLERALEELAQAQAERDAARAEVARLENKLRELSDGLLFLVDGVIPNNESPLVPWAQFARAAVRQSAPALTPIEYKRMTTGEWKYPAPGQEALRQPAPAPAPAKDDARDAMIEILEDEPAPAQPDATMLSDNSLQTSS